MHSLILISRSGLPPKGLPLLMVWLPSISSILKFNVQNLSANCFLVLANKKQEEPVKKGKGYKDAQWEAEVRKSLANKKNKSDGRPPALSKQDAALVQAQLEKEKDIRQRVKLLKGRLDRALRFVHSLVSAQVDEVLLHLSSIADLLLDGAFGTAVELVGYAAFESYLVGLFAFRP